MWTSVRTTTAAASRSVSMPWAATSVSATAAFSSATTSTPVSTAPMVSILARAAQSRPLPCGNRWPLGTPSPHLDPGGLRVKAGNSGAGLHGCCVLLVSVLQGHLPAPALCPYSRAVRVSGILMWGRDGAADGQMCPEKLFSVLGWGLDVTRKSGAPFPTVPFP